MTPSAPARLVGWSLAAALSFAPASAFAQTWEPHAVTVEPLTKARHSRLPPDEVDASDPAAFADRLQALQQGAGIRREDLAIIHVRVRGLWFLSVEAVAKERAAGLGANALVLEGAFGVEDHVGSTRIYRAVRLQRYDGLPVHTRSREAVEGPRGGRAQAAAPAFQPLKRPAPPPVEPTEDLEWMWLDQQFIRSHRLGVDLAGIADPAWRDLENTVRVRFPRAEHEKLLACRQRGSKVVLDLMKRTLTPAC